MWKQLPQGVYKSVQGEGVTHNCMVGGHPLYCHESQNTHTQESSSKASLEHRGVTGYPNVLQPRGTCDARMEEVDTDSNLELQDSMEDVSRSLAASIAVYRLGPTAQLTSFHELTVPNVLLPHASQYTEFTHPVVHQQQAIEDSGKMVLYTWVTSWKTQNSIRRSP